MLFQSKHPQYEYLRKKWIGKQKDQADSFLQKHSDVMRRAALGGVSGLMLLTTPGSPLLANTHLITQSSDGITKVKDRNVQLAKALQNQVPQDNENLNSTQETQVSQTLSTQLGLSVKPEIDGIRLNRTYGLIGGEQHLYRYPGDTVYQHARDASDWAMYGDAGIAPGLGAWGYFASSQQAFSKEDDARERYYIAVQTFLAPGFAENTAKYKDFFKYRKMVVVNPKTGQAVVADIADAGPSPWTGKHLGGSPEVMQALGLGSGPRKGAVLYFFIDDQKNQVPLGPISPKGE